ncbi:MAG: S9 family peptidase, partial [Deltaproteobacteria bacterium]|nr:S9 family peptidase [Deltaproteobacteria bacterium]
DPETLRSFRIYKHVLGTDPATDALVYEEKDDTFSVYVWRTNSQKYLVIGSFQTVSNEMRVLRADQPEGRWTVVQPRERDHEYTVDHHGEHLYVRTNLDAKNFRLMRTLENKPGKENWEEVIPHRDDVLLEEFELFANHLAVAERRNGLVRLRVRGHDGSDDHYVDFDDPAWLAGFGTNATPNTTTLRFTYTSMTTPASVFDYDMTGKSRTLRKEQPVLGGFDKSLYAADRVWATAKDGTKVPIALVYRKDLGPKSKRPTVLYGYGSYGYSLDATFSSARLSLLDRGFVWAVANIRGGEELGRAWYEDGKLLNKKNTFTDFVACGEHLVADGWADSERLYAMGGSAGGLLVGAVANMRPDLWDGVIAAVPFVDVVTTMLDDTIPLTTSEYDEWGNPNEAAFYDYMLSYSPYDQVSAQAYPAMLVTSGLHDSQVQFWEPTKWVAKLRTVNTSSEPILLHTNMDAGHGGKSGRFARYREVALEYAFLVDQAGLLE